MSEKELRAEIERLKALAPENLPKNESEWWIALKDQNREIERLQAQAVTDWIKHGDEIERLRAARDKFDLEAQQLDADNRRLKAVLLRIVTKAESDDRLTAWDVAEIARRALVNNLSNDKP